MSRPTSPKSRYTGQGTTNHHVKAPRIILLLSHTGAQPARISDGAVGKRQLVQPAQRSVKMLSKTMPTQQECMAYLKNVLPKSEGEEHEHISEVRASSTMVALHISKQNTHTQIYIHTVHTRWCKCHDSIFLLLCLACSGGEDYSLHCSPGEPSQRHQDAGETNIPHVYSVQHGVTATC